MTTTPDHPRYRWYILFLSMLTYGSIAGAARMCMPVLFPEISADLGLSMVAIGTIWGMDPLAGVFMGLPGGLLVDRWGVKRMLTVVCILTGIFCALRGFSVDFLSMAAFMFLFGLMAAVTPSIVPKVTAIWFAGKRLGLANGLLNVSWSIGAVIASLTSATLISPWLGGWQKVLFFFGIPPVLLGFLWLFTGREPKQADTRSETELLLKKSLVHVAHLRDVWLIALILMTYWGSSMGFTGYLALYLEEILGWEKTTAASAMTVLAGIGVIGVLPLVLLSDKIGSRKIVLFFSTLVVSLSIGLVPLVGNSGIWVLLALGGLLRSGVSALANTTVFEIKGIGSVYAGTAIGIANTLGMLGATIAPPIGNSLEGLGPDIPLYFWSVLGLLALPLILMVKETGTRVKPLPA